MKKRILSLLTVISAAVFMVTPVFAQTTITSMKSYQTYEAGDYTCDSMENADLTKSTISYEAGSKTGTFDLKKVTSVGLKKLSNTTYFLGEEEKNLENPIYVLNNNINSKCKYIPVYEVTGKEDGKNTFVIFGYYESNKVYVDSDAISEMKEIYQETFALDDESITEDGQDYYRVTLPDMETLELNVDEGYSLKNWEFAYSKEKGAYFKANILPTDASKIAVVKFYTLDENGKSVLTKTEEVEIGKAATAPVIDGEWDVDFSKVEKDMEVKQISSKSSTSTTSMNSTSTTKDTSSTNTTSASSEDGKEENPATGDASNLFILLSLASVAGVTLVAKRKKA